MKHSKEQQDFLMHAYLQSDELARTQAGDYQRFRNMCAERDWLDPEEMPCERTFKRWLATWKDTQGVNPTRVGRSLTDHVARTMTEEELLERLLSGEANYEEVEYWFVHHKDHPFSIDGKKIEDNTLGPLYPPKHTSAYSKEIKGFITGYLYARRSAQ